MTSITYVRSIDYSLDSRLQKYINILLTDPREVLIQVVCWNRDSEILEDSGPANIQLTRYNRQSRYGSGIKNIFMLLRWNLNIFKVLYRKKHNDVVHVCDFDCLLPVLLLKPIKKYKVIYDIYDFYDLSINLKNKVIKRIIRSLDTISYRLVDKIILPDSNRKKRITKKHQDKITIIENKPLFNEEQLPEQSDLRLKHPNVVFIGTLGKDRNLDKLITFAEKNPNYTVYIGGFGFLEQEIKTAAEKISNLIWLGKLSYQSVLAHTQKADFLFATYNPEVINNQYASPNKYYEAIFFLKPIMVSKNTSIEEKVNLNKIGFVVDYKSYEAIETTIIRYFNDKMLRADLKENLMQARAKVLNTQNTQKDYLQVIYG